MIIDLVDNDPNNCSLFQEILGNYGFRSRSFSCPEAFLAHMKSDDYTSPLAVIMDLRMPNKSGHETIDEARKIYPDQKFVIMSDSSEAKLGNELACFYLAKPVSLRKFNKAIDTLSICSKHGANPEQYDCKNIGDRCEFCVPNWRCPHRKT